MTVEWTARPDLPQVHNLFAATFPQADGTYLIQLRQDLGDSSYGPSLNGQPGGADRDVFYDVFHHELGHVMQGVDSIASQAPAIFGGALAQWDHPANLWARMIKEGDAETFKDVFSARRKWNNRTGWQLPQPNFQQWLALFERGGVGGGIDLGSLSLNWLDIDTIGNDSWVIAQSVDGSGTGASFTWPGAAISLQLAVTLLEPNTANYPAGSKGVFGCFVSRDAQALTKLHNWFFTNQPAADPTAIKSWVDANVAMVGHGGSLSQVVYYGPASDHTGETPTFTWDGTQAPAGVAYFIEFWINDFANVTAWFPQFAETHLTAFEQSAISLDPPWPYQVGATAGSPAAGGQLPAGDIHVGNGGPPALVQGIGS